MKHLLSLSWNFFYRDFRTGELTLLSLALILAVSSITTVAFFVDRVEQGIRLQSSQLIAADLVISSSRTLDPQRIELARQLELTHALTSNFRTVAVAGNATQLVEVKAVSTGYPLRGELRIADGLLLTDRFTTSLPLAGRVWVEPRLLQLTGLDVGDAIYLGAKKFVIDKVITLEPDRGGDLFSLAPRVLMPLADLSQTKLIQPASRVSYKLLLAGDIANIEKYLGKFKPVKKAYEEIIQVSKGRPELRFAFERAEYFLNLIALISIALSALAIVMTASRYSQRHLDVFALLRSMGFTQNKIMLVIGLELVWLLVLTTLIGTTAGFSLQFGLSELMGTLLLADLPAPTLAPVYIGGMTAAIALLGFAMPPLWLLRKTPPMRVLRRHLKVESGKLLLIFSIVASIALLYVWQLGSRNTTFYIMAGLAGATFTLFVLSGILFKSFHWLGVSRIVRFRFGLANLTRHVRSSALQSMAFGVGIFVLLFLVIMKTGLLQGWRDSMPVDTPNYFLVNIQKQQIPQLEKFYQQQGLETLRIYPMVRGRLIAINGKTVSAKDYTSGRAKSLVNREFNLSWLSEQQPGNYVIDGKWWSQEQYNQPLISLDVGIAKALKIWVGDKLRYDIAGQQFELTVSSIRAIEWNSFQANFFAVVPPGLLDNYSANWITSTYIPPEKKDVLVPLIRQFPNVSLIDIDNIIQRIRAIVEKVSLALEYMLVFTLLAGVLIMWASIQSTLDERNTQAALMRTLGATNTQLRQNIIIEFIFLGGVAGLIGGTAASILAFVLAKEVFKFDYGWAPVVSFYGLISGVVIVVTVGYLGTRQVLRRSPIETYRQV